MQRLKDKRALVTGGSSGIGLETARQFLHEGARVAITGADPDRLEAARTELGDALAIHADAGDVAGQQAVADCIRAQLGGLDILFVNAGAADFRPMAQWDEAGFDRSVAVNLKGPFFLIRALLPVLANPASIILNTSINARIGKPNSSVYSATKAGLVEINADKVLDWFQKLWEDSRKIKEIYLKFAKEIFISKLKPTVDFQEFFLDRENFPLVGWVVNCNYDCNYDYNDKNIINTIGFVDEKVHDPGLFNAPAEQ